MEPTFELKIDANARARTIIFVIFWIAIYLKGYFKRGFATWFDYIVGPFSIILFFYLLWQVFGSVKVILTNEKLTVGKRLFSLMYWQNSYELVKLEGLQKVLNDKAETYSSYRNFNMRTFIPELLRTYDINPSVLYFSYNGTRKKIGEGLEEFNADLIISEIEARKLKLAGLTGKSKAIA